MDSLSTAFYKTRLESCVPLDQAAYVIDLQFFGDSILVSPVTQNATSVTEYFPKEYFYDFKTSETITSALPSRIPTSRRFGPHSWRVHPSSQASSAMTTADLRKTDFGIPVAVGANGKASGSLYVDNGVLIGAHVLFEYTDGTLTGKGPFDYELDVKISTIQLLGVSNAPKTTVDDNDEQSDLILTILKNSRNDQKSDTYLCLG